MGNEKEEEKKKEVMVGDEERGQRIMKQRMNRKRQ